MEERQEVQELTLEEVMGDRSRKSIARHPRWIETRSKTNFICDE